MIRRNLNWISSIDPANEKSLIDLSERMISYYSTLNTRTQYEKMIAPEAKLDPVTEFFMHWLSVREGEFKNILEVGCGNGRIWEKIQNIIGDAEYTGIEVDEPTINLCKKKWPDQIWNVASVYDIKAIGKYDICYSFYVLEHLVFPAKGLIQMYSAIKKGGILFLAFPDFLSTSRFPSQQIGKGPERSTKTLLLKGQFYNAILTWMDINFNLKPALKNLNRTSGQFLINTNPVCLYYLDKFIWPDIDAVYLSHKKEIIDWAVKQGAIVTLPAGDKHPFDQHAIISIQKT